MFVIRFAEKLLTIRRFCLYLIIQSFHNRGMATELLCDMGDVVTKI